MTWVGLERYGYLEEAQRLSYRFLYMMTTAFVDFNGVVPEKVWSHSPCNSVLKRLQFDAVKLSHLVDAEYGNQVIDFKMVPREGFGWMNCAFLSPFVVVSSGFHEFLLYSAAYQVGLSFLTTHMRRAVAACTSPEVFFNTNAQSESALMTQNLSSTDPLGLAMEALHL